MFIPQPILNITVQRSLTFVSAANSKYFNDLIINFPLPPTTPRDILHDFEMCCSEQKRIRTEHTGSITNTPFVGPRKSASVFRTAPALAACLPVSVLTLQLGTTHRGRILRGTVAVPDLVVMEGVTLLLRDEMGDVVKVSRLCCLNQLICPNNSISAVFLRLCADREEP